MPRNRSVTGTQASHPVSLYDPRFEHDSCGTGFVARTSGEPSHEVVERALEALAKRKTRTKAPSFKWVSRPMRALVDLSDKEALYAVLDKDKA